MNEPVRRGDVNWAPTAGCELDRIKTVVEDLNRMPSRSELALALAYAVDRFCGYELAAPLWANAHRLRAEAQSAEHEAT